MPNGPRPAIIRIVRHGLLWAVCDAGGHPFADCMMFLIRSGPGRSGVVECAARNWVAKTPPDAALPAPGLTGSAASGFRHNADRPAWCLIVPRFRLPVHNAGKNACRRDWAPETSTRQAAACSIPQPVPVMRQGQAAPHGRLLRRSLRDLALPRCQTADSIQAKGTGRADVWNRGRGQPADTSPQVPCDWIARQPGLPP